MKELFDQHGDLILSVIAATAFISLILTLISADGLLTRMIEQHSGEICMTVWKMEGVAACGIL